MFSLVTGLNDMMKKLVVHRDLKLDNVMIHFPDVYLNFTNKEERIAYLNTVDLYQTPF